MDAPSISVAALTLLFTPSLNPPLYFLTSSATLFIVTLLKKDVTSFELYLSGYRTLRFLGILSIKRLSKSSSFFRHKYSQITFLYRILFEVPRSNRYHHSTHRYNDARTIDDYHFNHHNVYSFLTIQLTFSTDFIEVTTLNLLPCKVADFRTSMETVYTGFTTSTTQIQVQIDKRAPNIPYCIHLFNLIISNDSIDLDNIPNSLVSSGCSCLLSTAAHPVTITKAATTTPITTIETATTFSVATTMVITISTQIVQVPEFEIFIEEEYSTSVACNYNPYTNGLINIVGYSGPFDSAIDNCANYCFGINSFLFTRTQTLCFVL